MTPEQEKLIRAASVDSEPVHLERLLTTLAQVVLELREEADAPYRDCFCHHCTIKRAATKRHEQAIPPLGELYEAARKQSSARSGFYWMEDNIVRTRKPFPEVEEEPTEEHSFTGIRGKSLVESMREHIDRVRERSKTIIDEASQPPKFYTGPIEPGMIFEWPHTPSGSVVSRLVVDRVEDWTVHVHHKDSGTKNALTIRALCEACPNGPSFIPETEAERTARHLDEQEAEQPKTYGDVRESLMRYCDRATHMNHCNQGEYKGSCKYGDDDCPALSPSPLNSHEEGMRDSSKYQVTNDDADARNSTHDSRAGVRVRDELERLSLPRSLVERPSEIVDRILDRLIENPPEPQLHKNCLVGSDFVTAQWRELLGRIKRGAE